MVLKILRSPCLPLGSRICVGRCELRRCEWRNCDSCFLFPVGVIGTAGIQCTVPPQQQSADGCTCMPAAATVNHRHICLADDTPTVSCSFRTKLLLPLQVVSSIFILQFRVSLKRSSPHHGKLLCVLQVCSAWLHGVFTAALSDPRMDGPWRAVESWREG